MQKDLVPPQAVGLAKQAVEREFAARLSLSKSIRVFVQLDFQHVISYVLTSYDTSFGQRFGFMQIGE
ncbi:MAG: hypothetical protein GXP28_00930 [Planctomycetes bacterium]|nr:hypothetical protein [Planctomycetota bacterium]